MLCKQVHESKTTSCSGEAAESCLSSLGLVSRVTIMTCLIRRILYRGVAVFLLSVFASFSLADLRNTMNRWHENVVEPGITPHTGDEGKKKERMPELLWLPEYKWKEIYLEPFTVKDRAWGIAQSHVIPLSSLFLSVGLAKWSGWFAGYDNLAIKNIAWRVGDALGDAVQSYTPQELLWRLSVSNVDLLRPLTGDRTDQVIYSIKRAALYLPGLYYLIPEFLWEVGAIGEGVVPINIEPKKLQEHLKLSFSRSAKKQDKGAPPFASLDLEIMSEGPELDYAETEYENILMALVDACRREGVNRIRFYPVIESREFGDALQLYLRIDVNQQAGSLVRLPASIGQASEMDWWTNALDRHTLQGVFNQQDQYRAVKAWNSWKGYERPLANPFSEQILAVLIDSLDSLIIASQSDSDPKNGCKGKECWHYQEPDLQVISDEKEFSALSIPRQSINHTVISSGASGIFFIDDHISQRVVEPRISLLPRASFATTSSSSLVGLETHLPRLPNRGGIQAVSSVATSMAYGYLANFLYSYAMEEKKTPEPEKVPAKVEEPLEEKKTKKLKEPVKDEEPPEVPAPTVEEEIVLPPPPPPATPAGAVPPPPPPPAVQEPPKPIALPRRVKTKTEKQKSQKAPISASSIAAAAVAQRDKLRHVGSVKTKQPPPANKDKDITEVLKDGLANMRGAVRLYGSQDDLTEAGSFEYDATDFGEPSAPPPPKRWYQFWRH